MFLLLFILILEFCIFQKFFGLFALLVAVISFDYVFGEKYKIVPPGNTRITWEQARKNCQTMGHGWDLLKIQSRAEDLIIKEMLKCELRERGDGWFFGGISKNGMWSYADGDSMKYQAFGAMPLRDTMVAARTFVLYGAIFQSNLAWGYLYPYSNNIMGYICEAQYC
ncbi:uncharacterized protein LOC128166559 [Crassostrea angulata]|uniref:uncharacterized protein LOC128166559 n=1 Tax=Magallana angulata TaxID=2784310 RepID=UPI0022B17397|nr:uncharacterized protein LOC128166559 [Crassostrea angulata]